MIEVILKPLVTKFSSDSVDLQQPENMVMQLDQVSVALVLLLYYFRACFTTFDHSWDTYKRTTAVHSGKSPLADCAMLWLK